MTTWAGSVRARSPTCSSWTATHVRNVLAKLGARNRVQAVITAYESGFIR